MAALTMSTVLARSPEPLAAKIDDEIVMLDPKQSTYFGLDAPGAAIWEMLDEPRSLAEVCDRLVDHFEVDDDTCRRDVLPFATELVEAGLVVVRRAD